MSATNDEEIHEMEETVLKEEENGDAVVAEATTEQETEPMEVMAEDENIETNEEKKDSVEEVMDEKVDEEPVVMEETEEIVQDEITTDHVDETPQQDVMNVDNPEEIKDAAVEVEEVKQPEPISSRKSSVINKSGSVKASQTNLEKEGSNKSLNKSGSAFATNTGMIDKAFTEPASEQNEMRIYNGPIYCIEQVRIPPELPDIMKNYAKHIIRTQPDDVIIESYEYFKRLNKLRNSTLDEYDEEDDKSKNLSFSKGENHSDILDNSNFSINSENQDKENQDKKIVQLSPLELESFYERLLDYSNGEDIILVSDIRNMAEDANIAQSEVNEAIVVGSWDNEVEWLKFWSLIVAGSCTNLTSTLKVIIDIIGDENLIPLNKITTIIQFLLESDPNSNEKIVKDIISTLNERDGDVIEKGELNEILSVLNN